MAQIWLVSDTHFGHANILRFCRYDGTFLRPEFDSVAQMDEYMVDKWNSVVRPTDHVYHLGDVVMNVNHLHIVGRLSGHKRLILGNHDDPHMKLYAPYFEKIFSSRLLDKFLLTHIPVHPESLGKKIVANIHGHVHNNTDFWSLGPRYYNACVEWHNYTPIPFEQAKEEIRKKQEEFQVA